MQQLGYEVILTILVPGLILLICVGLILDTFGPRNLILGITSQLLKGEWQVTLVTVTAGTLLGSMLATVLGFLEGYALDDHAARRLGIKKREYDAEWDRYVDSLERSQNGYISRMVLFFQFESRTGLATYLLGFAIALWARRGRPWEVGISVMLLGALLFWAGLESHSELASFRHRRFAQPGEFPDDVEG